MFRNAVMPDAASCSSSLSDDDLLRQYVTLRDDNAFEMLVRRHGPMVRRVCLRILSNAADVEDAFQATFIVLARKAASPRSAELAGWLYGVAQHVARDALRRVKKRRLREAPAGANLVELTSPQSPPECPVDLRTVFDQELQRLPSKYRTPVVLCYLEGKTNDEAAAQLGCSRGKIAGTLARARDLLRGRLARRGLTVTAGALAAWLGQETAKAASVAVAVQSGAKAVTLAAVGKGATLSCPASALAGSTLKAMTWAKVKLWAALSLTAAAVAVPLVMTSLPEQRGVWQYRATLDLQPNLNFHSANPKNGTIRSLVFATDGKALVACASDRVAFIGLPAGVRMEGGGLGLTGQLGPLAMNPDGQTAILADRDGLWQIDVAEKPSKQGKPWQRLGLDLKGAVKLTLSADGKTLLAYNGAQFKVWDLGSGIEQFAVPAKPTRPSGVCLTPDGKTVVWRCQRNSEIAICSKDLKTGEERTNFRSPMEYFAGAFGEMALSPDGAVLAMSLGNAGNTAVAEVGLWDLATGRQRATLSGHSLKITSLVFSPDGKVLAVGAEGMVKVWEVASGRERATLPLERWTHALAFSPDGKTLAAGTSEAKIVVWDLKTDK